MNETIPLYEIYTSTLKSTLSDNLIFIKTFYKNPLFL